MWSMSCLPEQQSSQPVCCRLVKRKTASLRGNGPNEKQLHATNKQKIDIKNRHNRKALLGILHSQHSLVAIESEHLGGDPMRRARKEVTRPLTS